MVAWTSALALATVEVECYLPEAAVVHLALSVFFLLPILLIITRITMEHTHNCFD
jgi:hypothetical protein